MEQSLFITGDTRVAEVCVKKNVPFDQVNLHVHTSAVAVAKFVELRFKLLPHHKICPSCDFHLFLNLNEWLRVKKFSGNSEVIDAVSIYFENGYIFL